MGLTGSKTWDIAHRWHYHADRQTPFLVRARTTTGLIHLRRRKQGEQYYLLQLVSTFRNLEVTDPQDKIFAFLGLASNLDKVPRADVSQTVEGVCGSVIRIRGGLSWEPS